MKYFVYAKIGNYLYLQRIFPGFLSCRLNFVSFLSTLKKDLQKSCEIPIFVSVIISFKRRYYAHQTKN